MAGLDLTEICLSLPLSPETEGRCSGLPESMLVFSWKGLRSWDSGECLVSSVPSSSCHQPHSFLSQEAQVSSGPSSSLPALACSSFLPLASFSAPCTPRLLSNFSHIPRAGFWDASLAPVRLFPQRLSVQVPFTTAQQLCPSVLLAGAFEHLQGWYRLTGLKQGAGRAWPTA